MPLLHRRLTASRVLTYGWFAAMHSRVDLLFLHSQTEEQVEQILQEIEQRVQEIEQCANCFDSKSELFALNESVSQCSGNEVIVREDVQPELYRLLCLSKSYHEQTEGLFDVTTTLPSETVSHMNAICLEQGQVLISATQIRINMSGMLKGYAAEQIRILLEQNGVEDMMVNVGNSSVLTRGAGQTAEGWQVAVPGYGNRILRDICLTTSGNHSEARAHIIHPLTGELIRGKRTVSVLTADAVCGEVLSTCLFLATAAEKQRLLARFHISSADVFE